MKSLFGFRWPQNLYIHTEIQYRFFGHSHNFLDTTTRGKVERHTESTLEFKNWQQSPPALSINRPLYPPWYFRPWTSFFVFNNHTSRVSIYTVNRKIVWETYRWGYSNSQEVRYWVREQSSSVISPPPRARGAKILLFLYE